MLDRAQLRRGGLVGREPELALLRAALARAAAGEPSVVLVGGETGVGKTALVRALTAGQSTTVLYGACLPVVEDPLPYAPLIQALRRLGNTGTVRQQVARSPELARLIPGWATSPADLDHAVATASTKLALFQSVLDLIDKLGAAAPVLYVVEDVQWSDRSTLDLVRYLATNALQERVLLVVTYRDHDIVAGTPVAAWLAELGRLPITDRIAVERLDPLHASELGRRVASAQGAPVDADRLAAALTRSAGNPLFIEHLLRPGAPTDALPVTLQDLLGARVSGLPPAALRLLAVVSTLGRPATTDLVAAVLSWPAADVEAAAHASLEQAVLDVRSGGTLGFAHPAFGEVVWSSLLPSERARLHRRCAEVLATQADSVPGELARHWLGAGERAQALAASVAAGEAAERVYAFTDAAAAFDRALALADELGQVEARRGLLAKAAQASYLAGSTDAAIRHALDALAAPGDAPSHAELAERLGAYHFFAGHGQEAEEWLSRALDGLPPQRDSPLAARVYAGMALLLAGWSRLAEAEHWSTLGLAAARAAGARRAEGIVENALGMVALLRGDVSGAISHQQGALRIATELGGADDLALAYVNLTHSLGQAGRLDEVARVAAEGRAVVTRYGLATQFGGLLQANACEALVNAGRLDDAAAALAGRIGREPSGIMAAPALLQAGRLAMARGALDIARDRCEQARLLLAAANAPEAWWRASAEAAAEVELWAGRPESAYDIVGEALDLIAGTGDEPCGGMLIGLGLRALADRAELHRDISSRRDIRAARAHLEGRAAAMATGLPLDAALGAWSVAERGRIDLASQPEGWADAAAAWTRLGHALNSAYAAWREAEARTDRGVDGEAIAAVRRAHRAATSIGLPVLAAELERLAGWHRIDLVTQSPGPTAPSPAAALAAYQLTERELEVLGQLADGRTNREIADDLFISVKTASVHVSNILRKLEVSGRQEAARIAHRLGAH